MIVLGGLGSSWGSVLGAVLITVIYEYTRAYVQYQKIAFGIIMILIVLFLPARHCRNIGSPEAAEDDQRAA